MKLPIGGFYFSSLIFHVALNVLCSSDTQTPTQTTQDPKADGMNETSFSTFKRKKKSLYVIDFDVSPASGFGVFAR